MKRLSAGFTLVEMLVALVISSLLAVVVFGALNLSVRTSEKVSDIHQQSGIAFTTQHALRRVVGAMQDISVRDVDATPQVGLRGDDSQMIFIGRLADFNLAGTYFWLRLGAETDQTGGVALAIRRYPLGQQSLNDTDEDDQAVGTTDLDWDELETTLLQAGQGAIIDAPALTAIQLRYLKEEQNGDLTWQREWLEEPQLPLLISIRFIGEDDAPLALWPELFITPQVHRYGIKSIL